MDQPLAAGETFQFTFRVYTQPVTTDDVSPGGHYTFHTSFRSRIDLGTNTGTLTETDLTNNDDLQDPNASGNHFSVFYPEGS